MIPEAYVHSFRDPMIVIKATGAPDVKSLRKLAKSLSAEPGDISIEDIDVAPVAPARRKSGKPSVSTLPGAMISPGTQAAIMQLRPVEVKASGEYELS